MEASFFPNILAFGWIGVFLLIGVFLRAKVKFFQVSLLPAALIGGMIGFICINSGLFGLPFDMVGVPTSQGWKPIPPSTYSILVFHLFAFGFVGLGMLEPGGGKSDAASAVVKGSLWVCLVFLFSFAVQAVTGYGVFQLFASMGFDVDPIVGSLISAAFTQGPGQAQSMGLIWENGYQTQYAVSAGIGFAAIGFFVAGLVGVGMTYYGIKKGWAKDGSGNLSDEFRKGLYKIGNTPTSSHATAHPANVDGFALHLALFMAVYLIAYSWAVGWGLFVPVAALKPLGVGLNFIWCLFFGILLRKLSHTLGFSHLIDQDTVRRVTGTSVDLMLVAVFMAIAVSDIVTMLIPFIVTCAVGTAVTVLLVMWFSRRQKEYGFERMLAVFGLCTGTAASGLLLLRIIDPDFKSPAAVEIGLFNVYAFAIMLPFTFTQPFAPGAPIPFFLVCAAFIIGVPLVIGLLRLGTWKKQF